MKYREQLLVFSFYFLLIMLFYWKSMLGFFLGDEWYYFTKLLPFTDTWYGVFLVLYNSISDLTISGVEHYTPISYALYFLSVKFFNFTFWPYALSGIIIHVINSFLVYYLSLQLTRKKILAYISGIFFAISYIHFQAVTWAMTYWWTEFSVTFFLLSLIFLLKGIEVKRTRYLFFSGLCMISGFLTKESVAFIIFIIPIIFLLKTPGRKLIFTTFKIYIPLFAIFLAYRFLLPKFFLWMYTSLGETRDAPVSFPLDPALTALRTIIYPLKAITEVFVPWMWIQSFTENMTALLYPQYAVDQAGRGSTFTTFTQSAGSDMYVYLLSFLFIVIFILAVYYMRRQKLIKDTLLIGIAIIIFSSLPLILIATISPAWGYVIFFDSRHLYAAGVGGALIFPFVLFGFANLLEKLIPFIPRTKQVTLGIVLFFLGVWSIVNYILLQQALDQGIHIAKQREAVLNAIFSSVPDNASKKVILVESNTGYYGLAVMPPFQTNLGQALAAMYYQKKQLPAFFMVNDFLVKHGVAGEGYTEDEGKGFGYYITEKKLFEDLKVNHIHPNNVYAFFWDGNNDTIKNITPQIRKKVTTKLHLLAEYKNWKQYHDIQNHISFSYPPDLKIYDLGQNGVEQETTDGLYIKVTQKPDTLSLTSYVPLLQNSDGQTVGNDWTYRNITSLNGDIMTTLYATKGTYSKYFISSPQQDYALEVTAVSPETKVQYLPEKGTYVYNGTIEKILSSLSFNEKN